MSAPTRGARAGRLAAGAVLVVAALGGWGLPVDVASVVSLLPAESGLEVNAAGAWVALRPWPTLLAREARLEAEQVSARAARARITLGLGPLLRGRIVPTGLGVRDAVVRLRPGPDTGMVRCADLRGWAEPDDDGQWWIEGTAGCRWAGGEVNEARLQGRGGWTAHRGARIRGRLSGRFVTTGGVTGGPFEAQVRIGRDGVRLGDGRVAVWGGEITGRARYLASRARRRVALDLHGAGHATAQVSPGTPFVNGRWTMALRGRAAAPAGRPMRRHLAGYGRVVVLDGAAGPLDVGAALLDGLDVWRGRRRRRLRRRFPDVFGGKALAFDRAVAVVRAQNGRIDLYPLRARSRSYRAVGWARVGRRGTVTGRVDIVPGTALADALLGHGALRAIVGGGRDAEFRVPLVVTGRLDDLEVRPAPEFTRGVIERALGGTALGDVLDRLLDR